MKLVLGSSLKFADAIKILLPKFTDKSTSNEGHQGLVGTNEWIEFAAKRTTAAYDALYRINTTLREVRRVILSDISSVGSATTAKVLLPEKVLDGLEKLMVVHSEVVQKGLELDTQFDSKVSFSNACLMYWLVAGVAEVQSLRTVRMGGD